MKKIFSTLVLILWSVSLISCGGGGSGDSANSDFSGTWDARYNFSADDCGIVLEGVPGFVDQHFIIDADGTITLESSSGLLEQGVGVTREDGSFLVRDEIAGDIFGDGFFCTQLTEVSYQPIEDEMSESLFVQTLECEDGFFCASTGVGLAERVVAD